jgi:hypothetical protein
MCDFENGCVSCRIYILKPYLLLDLPVQLIFIGVTYCTDVVTKTINTREIQMKILKVQQKFKTQLVCLVS